MHPRHRLGISSLALDTSTQLAGRAAPEGILYSAGRDGLIISWDLGVSMKKRRAPHDHGLRQRDWEALTGWADEDEVDDLIQSDGDILGDVAIHPKRRQRIDSQAIPYERQWETDLAAYKPGKVITTVNKIQEVISASSDGTVKSWSPHLTDSLFPTTIGTHTDYVRCLAHSREQNWVASGSFDRTIKLWDLTREGQIDPIITFSPPDTNAPKSSIYAIAADPFGTTIASGSPERVIRLWDPRTGKRTGKLVGHTDNIRAMLMSEDAKYLLTGSTDASIKLWSLSTQRCLHTFTHHTESVWSLHSSHPTLDVFYSGDRSGLVCRVDVEGCADVSEGECILLCQDGDPSTPSSDGINKIVVMDDNLLWTASGHSNVKRWSVPQRRSVRASSNAILDPDGNRYGRSESLVNQIPSETSTRPSTAHGLSGSMAPSMQSLSSDTWPRTFERDDTHVYGIPLESLVRLISPNEAFTYSSGRGRDAEVATLYSAASIKSIPRQSLVRSSAFPTSKPPLQSSRIEDALHPMSTARADYEERELASDAVPLNAEPEDVLEGEHGLVRSMILNDRIHVLTIDTSGEVAVWDIIRGMCRGRFSSEDVAAISHTGSWAGESGGEKEHSPREVLEAVRERIEGEAVVSHWAMADTKAGVLTIHLTEKCFEAEVYADEVGYANDRRFNDESKINLGKWALRNLFIGFIREEQRLHRGREGESPPDGILNPSLGRVSNAPSRKPEAMLTNSPVVRSPHMLPALPPTEAPPTRSSPLMASLIPLHTKEITTPVYTDEGDSGPPPTSGTSVGDTSTLRERQPSGPGQSPTPASPDEYSGWGAKSDNLSPAHSIMGRLKSFGKTRRTPNAAFISPFVGPLTPSAELTAAPEGALRAFEMNITKSPAQAILSGQISPPSSSEIPTYPLPPNTAISISEEALPSYMTVYRGTVASTKHDVQVLEGAMPRWLLEYLLLNKIPTIPPHQKISFVLLPCPMPDGEDQLPELLNTTQSKLTSSRYLRVRKLAVHVQEKLEKLLSREEPPERVQPKPPPEDELEILCNDVVLHLNMSLAVVRQYIWKQSSELTMYYRRKLPTNRPREIKPLSHTSDL
ncbi:hypothetical protein C0993_004202 [Termitomyces sp. T159_Od127]|nr:hypothetical protein C0993_004202 [Termitomyces sp. T159_Od127]